LEFTRHGPVIESDAGAHRAYALRSGWSEPGMAPYFGSAVYMTAKTFAEFHHDLASSGTPSLNYVYADANGNIGWVPAGLAPIRPNWDGLMPVPGDGRYEWNGFWSGDQLPSLYNPASGYISTSNEMNLPAGYPYQERKLGFEWANGWRHARIEEVLKSLPKVSIEDSMRLQNDLTSIPARRLLALLAPLHSDDAKTAAALELLGGWDCVERNGSGQAALMEVWISRHLGRAFLEAILPKDAASAIPAPDTAVMLDTLERSMKRLDRDRLLLTTLSSAWLDMEKLQGADAKAWQWGKLHHSVPEHPLLDTMDAQTRARFQPGPFPAAGSSDTPNAGAYRAGDFQLTGGASFRMVIDVGKWDNSRAVNYPGQSGNPDDAHYRDLTGMWSNGEYFPLLYTRAAVEKATERHIVLKPAKN
jgi:penicillin amidase